MKILSPFLLLAFFTIETLAAPATTSEANASTPPSDSATALSVPAIEAILTTPFALTEGFVSQPQKTDLAGGGKAIFTFSIAEPGDYLVKATVNAPGEDKNSFYVNIDAPPEEPAMIWDFNVTDGFEEQAVSWRGSGDVDWSEFAPKIFKLSVGTHKLIFVGREPAQLKGISIVRWTPPAPGSLAEIKQRYAEADYVYLRDVRRLPDTPEGEKQADAIRTKNYQACIDSLTAAIRLAAAHPNSSDGFAALEWALLDPISYHMPAASEGFELMARQYATEPRVGTVIAFLGHYSPREEESSYVSALGLLKAVLAKNPDRTARGQAALALARLAKEKFEKAEAFGNLTELPRATKEAEAALEGTIAEYGDVPDLRVRTTSKIKYTIGQRAERNLQEIRRLSIGNTAPDIDGADTDGQPFKLSDYRGKVVLLVFWASWCGPCMRAVPHEKELVERFKGRPFVLIGVNGDNTLQAAAKAVKQNSIPWRSFWDGTKGPGKHISSEWNIRGWPTIYVIDHQGVIREKHCYGDRLDAPLEKLVAAAEKASR